MRRVVAAILGGGQGARLWPLTRDRAKPAVPLGGKFRLIDIPISNCLHAGIDNIFVLTQFSSASLHRHIVQTYRFDAFSLGFVDILAAEQNLANRDWFQGTADAVRQTLRQLTFREPDDILILSGDQLYLMDLAALVRRHRERKAELTIAVKPVSPSEASAFGIMRVDDSGGLVEFVEKPTDPDVVSRLALSKGTIDQHGLHAEPGSLLASMGIYVFKRHVLEELLSATDAADFGREVIPEAIRARKVIGFLHKGYWRDIGTIPSFHEASLELTRPGTSLDLYSPDRPIYTRPRFLPGCKIESCTVSRSVICGGTRIEEATITNSIIGIRARIGPGTIIEDSIIMGASRFERRSRRRTPHLGIGRQCHIKRAIIDLDACIGAGTRLVNERGLDSLDAGNVFIRDGIIVVPRGATIPPGTLV